MYVTDFYRISSTSDMPTTVRASGAEASLVGRQSPLNRGNSIGQSAVEIRSSNTLPGTIGLEGAFDSGSNLPLKSPAKKIVRTAGSKSLAAHTSSRKPDVGPRTQISKGKTLERKVKALSGNNVGRTAGTAADSEANSGESTKRFSRSGLSDSEKVSGREDSVVTNESGSASGSLGELKSDLAATEQRANHHPMNRKRVDLQVPQNTGPLKKQEIKGYYDKLVHAYLSPFANGIKRKSFFEILRRRTYSLTPPGANKGIQTILLQIVDSSK